MRPTLSIQEQQNRWDAERAQSGREATKQVVEEEKDELPMVSVLLRLPPPPTGNHMRMYFYSFVVCRLHRSSVWLITQLGLVQMQKTTS